MRTRAWVEQVMGGPVSIHVRAADPDRDDIAAAVARAFDRTREADRIFSTWRPDSDVMRLRRDPAAVVSPLVAEVHRLCEQAVDATQGLFTTDLVGPDGSRGWDPTGLVKGWAAERAATELGEVPGVSFCVNAAGDLTVGGTEPSTWRVGLQDPRDPLAVTEVVDLAHGGLATSGTAARGDHIIDPRTHAPAFGVTTVSVSGPSLIWCDVWAKVCFVDPERVPPAPYRLLQRA